MLNCMSLKLSPEEDSKLLSFSSSKIMPLMLAEFGLNAIVMIYSIFIGFGTARIKNETFRERSIRHYVLNNHYNILICGCKIMGL